MTPELFSDAMNEIGAKYVEEALTYKCKSGLLDDLIFEQL